MKLTHLWVLTSERLIQLILSQSHLTKTDYSHQNERGKMSLHPMPIACNEIQYLLWY